MTRSGAFAAVIVAAAALLFSAPAASATVHTWGYFATRDGTKLRYDLLRPDAGGRHPVLLNYEGYAAGSDATDNGVSTYSDRLLQRGYALLGVSVRGTGCSEGVFDPFALTMGRDGADAVEWAARQPWSNGRVGMIGVSFGAITQLLTAADRPPHLRAITPDSATSDLYRDVVYPGGILEYDFTFAWTGVQKESGYTYATTGAPAVGDVACEQNFAKHEAANAQPQYFIPTLVVQNPFIDDSSGKWLRRAPSAGFKRIDVPTYLFNQWQDEQLPGRIYDSLGMFGKPKKVWADFSNGNHGRALSSPTDQNLILAFLDHFVRGVPNGIEKQPHLRLDMETAIVRNGKGNEPAWSIKRRTLNADVDARPFYLNAGGKLTRRPPRAASGSDSYNYPRPAPDVTEPGPTLSVDIGPPPNNHSLGQLTWKGPVPPGGSLAYTTPKLKRTMVFAGPASLDLWLKSTATDTDLEATVTEVRPDGQETYVQRGWLRASHRKLDPQRSTALRPLQTQLRRDARPLVPGKPTRMRLEIFPFAHTFRAGSRLRVWIEAPTGHTGFWAFQPVPQNAVNTVLRDRKHPSRLVLGLLGEETAHAPLPPCDSLRNQPCRPDPLAH
ncbi:MAG: CocE/NonD family hydrolase [Actinobacteria bacterium]|nr:CocE/NonD family hydrolase [Actinomycetota bacterium]